MTFAEEYARTRGQPIEHAGQLVFPSLRYRVAAGARLRIRWRASRAVPVQGLCLTLRDGKRAGRLAVDGVELAEPVLWLDTAPAEVVLACVVPAGAATAELRLWNCWRDDTAVMNAWLGNAGMRAEPPPAAIPTDGVVRVACNARPEITFADLVFDLAFVQ